MEDISLYIHIPFCVKKCAYCDFLSFAGDEETKEAYVKALCLEIEFVGRGTKEMVRSVFVGGGTPTAISGEQLSRVLESVRRSFRLVDGVEVSIEMNPGTLEEDKMLAIKEGIVNRVSIGLQSTFSHHLKRLSRIHSYEDFLETYKGLRQIGIGNINVDLMFGLPGQTLAEWEETLRRVCELGPDHLSCYGLIIEEDTRFYQMYLEGKLELPDEETERTMYYMTRDVLREYGYYQYEISNYAKEGRECLHNESYWMDIEYEGLGLGASSYRFGERLVNTSNMDKYLSVFNGDGDMAYREVTEIVDRDRRLEERMFLGLRMNKGVDVQKLALEFDDPLNGVYKEVVEKYVASGHLAVEDGFVRLTDKGRDVSNQVFGDFLIE